MAKFNLEKKAADFAGQLSKLLNQTVCNGIRLSSVVRPGTNGVWIGFGIDRRNLDPTVGIPLGLGGKAPTGYLALSYRLGPDHDERYLMVQSSFMGLFVDPELARPVMHYDYERDKGDGYPEAHMQICAESSAWDELCASTRKDARPLERLHFPVGGRRFRPTLEDLIDFLITEKIAAGRTGALQALDDGRAGFLAIQLRAAIRRDPETAKKVLADHDLL